MGWAGVPALCFVILPFFFRLIWWLWKEYWRRWLPICGRRCCGPPLEKRLEEGRLSRGVAELGSSIVGRSVAVLRRSPADRWLGGREISGEGRRLGVLEELGRRCDGLCSLTGCC
uniref:Uncharacterized protein n=1 Tax=Populus alba TaxID=43335 RepID=A0A4U5QY64_POPAL|nr:hypothetical protein D5086_0000024730 [Populus alba]